MTDEERRLLFAFRQLDAAGKQSILRITEGIAGSNVTPFPAWKHGDGNTDTQNRKMRLYAPTAKQTAAERENIPPLQFMRNTGATKPIDGKKRN